MILLGGGANADGRAFHSELPTTPVDFQSPQSDVDVYYKVEGAEPTLTSLRPGLSETGGFGPEISIGRKMADLWSGEADTRVALIKYAKGGTNLHVDWKAGGDSSTLGDGSEYVLFQETVNRGRVALAAAYPNAVQQIEGMLWAHGEADADSAGAPGYQHNLTQLIDDVRATYGMDLPFMIARLSMAQAAIQFTYLNQIRASQDAVEDLDPRTGIVDTDHFGMNADGLHFDGNGLLSMGAAFSEKLAYHEWMLAAFTSVEINNGKAEPDADPDGDGKTNHAEFLGNSGPKDASSHFRSWIFSEDDKTARIHYDSSPYREYAIERYEMFSGTWREILPREKGNGGVKSRVVDLGSTPDLFRVRSELP
ncbi:hypothetical protein HW115_15135 [Verrucomicrobiaceae bacterium N1E253]|uniref:Sialate O-acetylesterase domain-containing protein n=1 Tax=Oceaniferula marina TaxID=2748318 RepID=A0A851GPA5_9BACT|nr:sialate O-acetylesterase [Oceaniferula marina]NWK56955.1 hypothetical protein [Oceaniferula marina]